MLRRPRPRVLCTLEQWRTAHGGVLSDAALRELERGRPAARVCGAMLRALATHEPAAIAALDTIARTGAPGWEWTGQGNLVLARLLEGAGDTTAAYEAVQPRGVHYLRHNRYLATILGEHWRLGVAVGDTAGAAAAARHFLALRDSPEPVLTSRRDSIRAWLTVHQRR